MSTPLRFRNVRRLLLATMMLLTCALQDATADNASGQDELDQVLDYLVTQRLSDRASEQEALKTEQRAQLKRTAVGMQFDPDSLRPLESLSSKFKKNLSLKEKRKRP